MATTEVYEQIDHTQFQNLILEQFKSSDNINAMIDLSMQQGNKIEQCLYEIKNNFYLDMAEGVQLDILGRVFNELRQGRIDADYRLALQEKGALNFSGEPESIISILKSTYGATYVNYRPDYPGKFYINTDAEITHSILEPLAMAGVLGQNEEYIVDANDNFLVDANGNNITAIS